MILDFFYSAMAAMFFALLFNVPKRSVPVTAVIAGIGYTVFLVVNSSTSTQLSGFFLGTLVIAVLSELAARIMKLATTIFVTTAVIPLVPGLGLYQTMYYLVQNDNSRALEVGAQAMLAAGTIAMAIAITTLLVRLFLHLGGLKKTTGSS